MDALLSLLGFLVGLFLDLCRKILGRYLLLLIALAHHHRLAGIVGKRCILLLKACNQLRVRRCRHRERLAIQRQNDFRELRRASIDIARSQRNEYRRLRSTCAARLARQRAIQGGRLGPLRPLPLCAVRVVNP